MRLTTDTALLLIDVQRAFHDRRWGKRSTPEAEANIARLLAAWRTTGLPIVHVRHDSIWPTSPLAPDAPGNAVLPEAAELPGEPVVRKTVNSAFIGTTLEQDLRRRGITGVVLVGITTDHCVSTSARMAANLGFHTWVVADATCTFERTGHDGRYFSAEEMHATALASLHAEFAAVVETTDVVTWVGALHGELLQSA
ncbi:MAG TPA: cysteine hydrolase family protein [Gemmatimonadaceae bacterium]|nr:cysteine hydrolase family protein [Gemmatimonadaceae bacterium]